MQVGFLWSFLVSIFIGSLRDITFFSEFPNHKGALPYFADADVISVDIADKIPIF